MSNISSSDRQKRYIIQKYTPRHSSFPYTQEDLTPTDTDPAPTFYTTPRIVTHIDGPAITALGEYYATNLVPAQSTPASASAATSSNPAARIPRILDLCTSHISHLPSALEARIKDRTLWLCGIGMNAAEMRRNAMLRGGWAVHDLDAAPTLPPQLLHSAAFDRGQVTSEAEHEQSTATAKDTTGEPAAAAAAHSLDATTCVVSIDYLRNPLAVLSSVRAHTRPGGSVHLVISNRCFPTKAVRRWLRVGEAERLQMCGDYLWWSGWRDVEIVTLKDGLAGAADGVGHESEEGGGGGGLGGRLAQLMRGLGVAGMGSDPLWVVRGRKSNTTSTTQDG